MIRRASLSAVALALAWICAAAPARATEAAQGGGAPAAPACKSCKSTGALPCPEHPKEECPWERSAQFCSFVEACAPCRGVGFVDCKDCDNAASDKDLAARAAKVAALRPELARYDAEMGRPLRKAASEHFTLVWEIDNLKVAKRVLGAHELLHLYLDRLEDLFAQYLEVTHARAGDFAERHRIFVWWLVADQEQASLRFCQQGAQNGVKLMGSSSAYSVCGNRQFFTTDERLHRNLVHSVTHLLFAHERPSTWIGNQRAGWVEEGLAHVFEERIFGICDNYCYEEQNSNRDFKGGKWKVAVRKMVAEGTAPAVSDVIQRNTDQLLLPEHAVAMSLVEYLLQLEPGKFDAFGKRLRGKAEVRDALQAIFGLTPLQLEAAWKEWVLATYPKQ